MLRSVGYLVVWNIYLPVGANRRWAREAAGVRRLFYSTAESHQHYQGIGKGFAGGHRVDDTSGRGNYNEEGILKHL